MNSSRWQLVLDAVHLCRVRHWVKNVFVLVPFLFAKKDYTASAILTVGIAFACFCLLSSAVYCLNDVIDAPADRAHPRKRTRPVASGRIRPSVAIGMSLILASVALLVASFFLPLPAKVATFLYFFNSLAYCFFLRARVIVDVLVIAIGFVLRLLAGSFAVGAEPSSWLIVCGFSLALILGFGKRRSEIATLSDKADYRPVLDSYSASKLDLLLGVSSAICLLSYMLYTIAPETAALHGTKHLVYTVPFVFYGVLRFVFKTLEGRGDGPVEILTTDPVFTINGLLWCLVVILILANK